MSICDEDEVKVDPVGLSPIPFSRSGELHRIFVRTLYEDMGWTFLQIAKFFGRTEGWAVHLYPPEKRPKRRRVTFGWEDPGQSRELVEPSEQA